MTKLTYEDLKFPSYINSSTAVTIRIKDGSKFKNVNLTFCDVVAAAEISGLNMLFISDTGRGKTQLVSDIAWHHFGGDDEGGNANWADGRPNFEMQELFERTRIIKNAEVYDSDEASQLKTERTSRPFFNVDELNRAPKVKQNEFFDAAEGKYTYRGKRKILGRDGYALFTATANFNKSNGDFQGTFELDRSLLNRAHLTLDLDHKDFRPTSEDKIAIDERDANPRIKKIEPRDISEKIINEYQSIMAHTRTFDPYILAFKFMIDDGLNFCDKDLFKEKTTTFPTLCGDCNYSGKDLCSLVKSSSDRTTKALKALAYGLTRVVELKLGKYVEIDNLDAALQAYKFTTYHGNLNDVISQTEYGSRKQELMTKTIEELGKRVETLKEYLPILLQGKEPVVIKHNASKGGGCDSRKNC